MSFIKMSDNNKIYRFRLTITSKLPNGVGYIPVSPVIDFAKQIEDAQLSGVFDGLIDIITHDNERKATLFLQYFDANGKRRLRKHGHVNLPMED